MPAAILLYTRSGDRECGEWVLAIFVYASPLANPTASRRHSSKPSNAIMLGCRSCRMLRP